jgi:hypothetical protein
MHEGGEPRDDQGRECDLVPPDRLDVLFDLHVTTWWEDLTRAVTECGDMGGAPVGPLYEPGQAFPASETLVCRTVDY